MVNFELSKKVKVSMKSFRIYRARMIMQRSNEYAAVEPPTMRFDCMHF